MNRSTAARIAAHSLHAQGKTNTVAARAAFHAKFERQVDPEGVLSADELAKRVAHAKSVYYAQLAAKRRAS